VKLKPSFPTVVAARKAFEHSSFVLDCDTPGCGARGVFDTIQQTGGWLIDGTAPVRPGDEHHRVVVLCPRCNDRRKAKGTP
jgi:hypothetical protein